MACKIAIESMSNTLSWLISDGIEFRLVPAWVLFQVAESVRNFTVAV